MALLTQSNLKIGAMHHQAFMPKVWVEDVNCLVPLDEYLKELSCRDLTGGGTPVVDPSFANLKESNTAQDNADIIHNILLGSDVVTLPIGEFLVGNITIEKDNVIFSGSGMPDINQSNDGLVGGSIIKGGRINVNNKYNVTIQNLGIDVSMTNGSDAILSGLSQPGIQRLKVFNVIALGAMGGHGVSMTSGDYNVVRNFRAYNFNHPFALRCSYSIVDNYYSYAKNDTVGSPKWTAASGGVIKSVDDGGLIQAKHNVVSNGIVQCESLGSGRGFIFSGFSTGTECLYNVVSNITFENTNFGITFGGIGVCNHNVLSNCVVYRSSQNAVLFEDGANQNTCTAIKTRLCGSDSFVNQGTGVQNDLYGCGSVGQAGSNVVGTFRTSEVLN